MTTVSSEKTSRNYVFIDYENVQPLFFKLNQDFKYRVICFVGARQTRIPVSLACSMQALGHDAEYVQVSGTGKNALDFHISLYVGKLFEQDPAGHFHIISKDTGFDPLIQHLQERNAAIQRHDDINNLPLITRSRKKSVMSTSLASNNNELIMAIGFIKKQGDSKPSTLRSLKNALNMYFFQKLPGEAISGITKQLLALKAIEIKKNKLKYSQDFFHNAQSPF